MRGILAAVAVLFSILSFSTASAADTTLRKAVSIPPQGLESALQAFARERELHIVFINEDVANLRTNGASGDLTVEEALNQILAGTGLTYQYLDERTITVVPVTAGLSANESAMGVPDGTAGYAAYFGHRSASYRDPVQAGRSRPGEGGSSAGASARATDEVPGTIEEVIVTAQKREQRLIEVPLSVTALGGEALKRAGIDTLLDLSHAVPGLVVSDAGGGFMRYYIRGIGNVYGTASTSLVGVYLDEADVTGSASSQLDLRTQDIERVEVLKGPQGTLYGAGASGGIVRFITNDPELDRFTASGSFDAYSTDGGDSSQAISTVLNIPVVEDVFGLRAVGNFGNLGGWVDQPAAGLTDVNNQDLREVRVKGLWQPTDRLTVEGMVYLHRNEGDGVASSTDENYRLDAATDPARSLPFSSDFDIYNLTVTYDRSSMTVLSSTTFLDNSSVLSLSQKYALAPPPAPLFEALSSGNTTDTRSFSQEIRLNGDTGRFNWTAGAFYKDVFYRNRNTLLLALGDADLGTIPLFGEESSRSGSLFGDVSYALTPRAEIGAGVRYFKDELQSFDGTSTREGNFHSVDPRLYFSYAFAPDVRMYLSAAEGFRSGGFNTENGELTTFEPEKVRSYELGVKSSLLESTMLLEAAVFLSNYDDIQMFRLQANNVGSVDNGGDAEVRGIDVSVDWQATERLLLQFRGNLTDSEIERLAPGVVAVIVGDPVDYTTDYAASAAATYAFDWADEIPGFIRLGYRRLGPTHVTDRSIPVPILYESQVNNFLNARIGLQWNRWSIAFFGENLTNENRLQDANGGYGFGARPRPRTVGLTIGASFE